MNANEREFMKRIQAQLVEISVIHPPTYVGGYVVFVSPCLCGELLDRSCRRKAAEIIMA